MDNYAITYLTELYVIHNRLAVPDCRVVPTLPIGWVGILGAVQEGIAGPGFLSGNVQGVNISLQGVVDKPETPLVQVFHTHVPFLRT